MKVLFFAWLRDKAGTGEMEVFPPDGVSTVSALMDWLAAGDARRAEAFSERKVVRAAVNREFAEPDTPITPGDEVAFFPPVTGG